MGCGEGGGGGADFQSLGQGTVCAVCRSQVCVPYSPPQSWGWLGAVVVEDAPGAHQSLLLSPAHPSSRAVLNGRSGGGGGGRGSENWDPPPCGYNQLTYNTILPGFPLVYILLSDSLI